LPFRPAFKINSLFAYVQIQYFATIGAQTKAGKKRLFDKFFDNFARDLRKVDESINQKCIHVP